MKKFVYSFVVCLLVLSFLSINTSASNGNSLEFLNKEWSKDAQYPDWYGGRYIDNDTGSLIYVVVNGYQSQAISIIPNKDYIIKENSYNKLMITLDEITTEWMSTQAKNETVCLQSAALDEFNNCISVELYSGSDKVDAIRDTLYERYGSLITISTTDSLIQLAQNTNDSGQHIFYWTLTVFALLSIMSALLIWRKRTSLKVAMQTVRGDVITQSFKPSKKAVVMAVKKNEAAPSKEVFQSVLDRIEKQN